MGELQNLIDARQKVGQTLDEKLRDRDAVREEKRKKKERDPKTEARERELEKEIAKLAKEERELTHRIKSLRNRDETLEEKIKRERKEKHEQDRVVLTPGAPHWMGSDDILENEVEPVAKKAGFEPNSAKRDETYGNPSSDHYVGNLTASARDFPTASNYTLLNQIANAVVGRNVSDYENVYFERAGHTFRFQGIAANHGTGPHLHIGIRYVG